MKRETKVLVSGGGWGGCAAAEAAALAGARVTLLERTDMLLGTGLVGGIFRNNGRFAAAEELIALGCGLVEVMDACARHRDVDFPGHRHASLYDVYRIEPAVQARLEELGVRVLTETSGVDAAVEGGRVVSVRTSRGETLETDALVDASGTSATPGNCVRHGKGCALCILRCPAFTPRVSLTTRLGVEEYDGHRADGTLGAMSGSCKLFKESLDPALARELDEKGVCLVPVPEAVREDLSILGTKACQQYALKEFVENLVLLDTGPAKLMTPTFPLEQLRRVPGMERARFEDPLGGGRGNSMRFFRFARCDASLRARGPAENLFCAGERGGPMVGHTEALVTGALAGHNAARCALGLDPLVLPPSLACGDFVAHVLEQVETEAGRGTKFTFSGSVYLERMKALGLDGTDAPAIRRRVEAAGLRQVFRTPLTTLRA
ncbi:FAD-dependent pyridine nucleotide-disulfide oxidoreductase [Aminomonas paucivorans DSM 12260]|uniref:FAD-dependent pyridine nucleotide-disulfide oxidoreductase n=1 Tax=Aminomonas paucivorans DSM 12260 TaxID=584708 RepID=E3CZN2_9BACT|nr:FAD-dependent oxidoreductase [Aminomonas paucivorans]EFQ24664.1 FAD-dependent pyridine nucleotide-disulfide oxidoreductase [Aminomonas paucivorans DSM 12260]